MDEEATDIQRYGKVWILGGFSVGGGLIGLPLSGGKDACFKLVEPTAK